MERLEAIKEVVKQEIRQNLKQELTSLGFSQRGTNLQPPRSHIHMSIKGSCAPKDESAKPEADPLSCLCTLAMNIGKEPIQLKLDPDVIGKPNEIPFYISQRDILDLIMRNEMICISVLQLWLMYLHHLCISKGIIDMYGFIDPLHIQRMGNKADNIYSYIHSRICGFRNECYLAPCFHLAHWQLMIICPRQNRIIFLCSLGLKPKDKFKNLVDLAMDACHVLEGSSTSKKKATWIFPNVITTTDPFSREEIDDIRRRWATYLLEVAKK
ncbi:Papain-like cysteine peptidase superfamily [Sesbania bispinosa]|nr:Papain-like cysteine peptidase superfamily [Sesbania bispinosa]